MKRSLIRISPGAALVMGVASTAWIDTIFTIDRADFEIYRLPRRKRFRIVP